MNRFKTVKFVLLVSALWLIACDKGPAEGTAEGTAEGNETEESQAGGEETPTETPEETPTETPEEAAPAALEWTTVGDLAVQAEVPAGATVTSIGAMWSVRTPDCEFRVTPPPEQEFMAETHERAMGNAERGSQGAMQEVLLDEQDDSGWFLGYSRDDNMHPGETKWNLTSGRVLGDATYKCSTAADSLAAYECAVAFCRTLRVAQ